MIHKMKFLPIFLCLILLPFHAVAQESIETTELAEQSNSENVITEETPSHKDGFGTVTIGIGIGGYYTDYVNYPSKLKKPWYVALNLEVQVRLSDYYRLGVKFLPTYNSVEYLMGSFVVGNEFDIYRGDIFNLSTYFDIGYKIYYLNDDYWHFDDGGTNHCLTLRYGVGFDWRVSKLISLKIAVGGFGDFFNTTRYWIVDNWGNGLETREKKLGSVLAAEAFASVIFHI